MIAVGFRPLEGVDVRRPTGSKLGTESNGGFKNIIINNCTFESCRGFSLKSVDGGVIDDIIFSDIAMRDIRNLRCSSGLQGVCAVRRTSLLKRVIVRGITCYGPANVGARGHR